jgi:hypothetical protein
VRNGLADPCQFSVFSESQGFDPETVKLLVTTFERTRDQLDLPDRLNPLVVQPVAKLTIDFAKEASGTPLG